MAEAHGGKSGDKVRLDPGQKSKRADEFERQLSARVVGQHDAIRLLGRLYQTFLAGIPPRGRPLGTALFLGPTGSGKTHIVEAMAETIFGDPRAFLKIDCAEYQQPHELAKLVGSPPGYIGHRETAPLLSQENIDRHQTPQAPLSLILFDEIEKACDPLWHLLLGVLDRATLSLGDNRSVDFSRCIIVMTSNLGAREMSEIVGGGMGFSTAGAAMADAGLNRRIHRAAVQAARRKFSPEFMNRIDQIVVFRPLNRDELRQILDIELQAVHDRIRHTHNLPFVFECTDAAKELLLREGTDEKYGARHLKRAIERLLVSPFSTLIATAQLDSGDVIVIDVDPATGELVFEKHAGSALMGVQRQEKLPIVAEPSRASVPLSPKFANGDPTRRADTAMQQLTATLHRAGLL